MNEEGLRVLITGGAGFIGSNLTRKIVVYNDKLNRYYSGKHPNTLDFVWSHDQAPGTQLNIHWLEPRYRGEHKTWTLRGGFGYPPATTWK